MATIPVKISDCILLSNAKKRLIIDFRTTCEVKLAQHISQKKKKGKSANNDSWNCNVALHNGPQSSCLFFCHTKVTTQA